jgi:hypothetical protein
MARQISRGSWRDELAASISRQQHRSKRTLRRRGWRSLVCQLRTRALQKNEGKTLRLSPARDIPPVTRTSVKSVSDLDLEA